MLPRLASAGRLAVALASSNQPRGVGNPAFDPTQSYVHRTSALRGESRAPQWTGGASVFAAEEAWAIRGLLHPAWRDQPLFTAFLGCPEVELFVRSWSSLPRDNLGLGDAALFVNPREADFSEGWHRDVRWHKGKDYLQQETERLAPDTSLEAERERWAELQEDWERERRDGLGADGVSMFLALAPDEGCHELVPGSHLRWRTEEERAVLKPLGFDWAGGRGLYQHGRHEPLSTGVAVRLQPGQGLIRHGYVLLSHGACVVHCGVDRVGGAGIHSATIHRGRTLSSQERLTLLWSWQRAPIVGTPAAGTALGTASGPSASGGAHIAEAQQPVDGRMLWALDPSVRGSLPTGWMRAAYDRWRATVRDGGRCVDRMNANELERLSDEERTRARALGSASDGDGGGGGGGGGVSMHS